MKKALSIIMAMVMLLSCFACFTFTASAKSSKGFDYKVSGKSAIITAYTGSDSYVTIPSKLDNYKVVAVGDYAFMNNNTVKTVIIPNGVTELGHWSFGACTALKEISIPKTVNRSKEDVISVNACAFGGCKNLKNVYYGGTEKQWKEVLNFAFEMGNNDALKKAAAHCNTTAPTQITKITSKSKGFKATWSKRASTGYVVQYSTAKSFAKKATKSKTIKNAKTLSTTVGKLKGKKTYYVRVRTYKTVNGKKCYSAWSKVKTVTTK